MAPEESKHQGVAAVDAQHAEAVAPVVVERTKKKKKKKRKYSKNLRDAQRMERRLGDASHRVARAVADGLKTYRKRRDKSARKKRDGAVLDFIPNAAEGLGTSMRKASRVPVDLAKFVNTKRVRRQVRGMVRLMQPFR